MAAVFDAKFWQEYADILSNFKPNDWGGDPIPPTRKKYHSMSSSVLTVQRYFDHLKLAKPSSAEAIAALKSPFTRGDPVKAFHMLRFFQMSADGLFLTNESKDKFGVPIMRVGAENWNSVMCYLDALLFSMFATLESFEPILFISNQNVDPLVDRLAAFLRLYVSLIRSGNLITTDITIRFCEIMSELGFHEALSRKQEDSASLFEFLTEVLAMPLLTFKVDIKHSGKFSKEDEKYSKERMLFVSVPSELRDQETITLEDCLEHYFNNSISVKRELERRATLSGTDLPTVNQKTVGADTRPDDDIDRKADLTPPNVGAAPPGTTSANDKSSSNVRAPLARARSSTLSLWSHKDDDSREVNLPAWMFLRMLPFYTDDKLTSERNFESVAKNSREFAKRRPILPICLKRYSYVTESSSASRLNQKIVIPPIIELPSFIADDLNDDVPGDYKLILESAVCHRGTTISSGHFVSVVRKDYQNLDFSPQEALESTWLLYDDLKKEGRIVEKTFKEIFDTEWPYILFYRLVPKDELSSAGSSIHKPEGFKGKYWNEPELSTIFSGSTPDSLTSSNHHNDSRRSSYHNSDSRSSSYHNSDSRSSSLQLDIPPTSAKFEDIKNRYFWYVTSDDKNYYKEMPDSRNSVSIRPRRNSQWSNNPVTPVLPVEKKKHKHKHRLKLHDDKCVVT